MLQREREEFLQPEEDLEKVMKMLSTAYVQYVEMLRRLEAAHAHLLHRQKRAAVRQALDGVTGRLLEIKREMVALEKSECHAMDGVLMALKRVPVGLPRWSVDSIGKVCLGGVSSAGNGQAFHSPRTWSPCRGQGEGNTQSQGEHKDFRALGHLVRDSGPQVIFS